MFFSRPELAFPRLPALPVLPALPALVALAALAALGQAIQPAQAEEPQASAALAGSEPQAQVPSATGSRVQALSGASTAAASEGEQRASELVVPSVLQDVSSAGTLARALPSVLQGVSVARALAQAAPIDLREAYSADASDRAMANSPFGESFGAGS